MNRYRFEKAWWKAIDTMEDDRDYSDMPEAINAGPPHPNRPKGLTARKMNELVKNGSIRVARPGIWVVNQSNEGYITNCFKCKGQTWFFYSEVYNPICEFCDYDNSPEGHCDPAGPEGEPGVHK